MQDIHRCIVSNIVDLRVNRKLRTLDIGLSCGLSAHESNERNRLDDMHNCIDQLERERKWARRP